LRKKKRGENEKKKEFLKTKNLPKKKKTKLLSLNLLLKEYHSNLLLSLTLTMMSSQH
jgi:hypothetical protein